MTLQIPLYVSYISHSPTRIPWRHYDLSTDLRLTFVYDTAKMWTEGIGTPPESELPGMSHFQQEISVLPAMGNGHLFFREFKNFDESSVPIIQE